MHQLKNAAWHEVARCILMAVGQGLVLAFFMEIFRDFQPKMARKLIIFCPQKVVKGFGKKYFTNFYKPPKIDLIFSFCIDFLVLKSSKSCQAFFHFCAMCCSQFLSPNSQFLCMI
jgi:hypothetical protein